MTEPATSARITIPAAFEQERPLMYAAYVMLLIVVLFSTYLHAFRPEVLSVPDNLNVSAWQAPTFAQTTIHGRLTAAESQKVLTEGIPNARNLTALAIGDFILIILGWWCFRHARKHYGFWMASCFFIGSFVFTGLEENSWILAGRWLGGTVSLPPGGTIYGTYWFTKGLFWFIECPITACIGWFVLAYSSVWIAGQVFPRMGLLFRATVGGLIAMAIDLWMDPIATAPVNINWVWGKGDPVLLLGIPLYNFIGWFLLIFLFAIFWDYLPRIAEKSGVLKATAIFLSVSLCGSVITAGLIFVLEFLVVGMLLHLAGLQQTLSIPPGW
jgi:hypothetical protein